jgi:phospholipid-binding lipoprotein MlaA
MCGASRFAKYELRTRASVFVWTVILKLFRLTTCLLRPAAHAAGAISLTLALGACATPPEDPVARAAFEETNDPLEPLNRYIFDVNLAIDEIVLTPISTMYVEGVPEPYQNGIRNFLQNLAMPVTILNSALQGDGENFVDASVSFFINTTAGLGGIFDIPGNFDKEPRKEDFGQTLGVWGVDEGPYLVLPLIGPSGVRDGVGLGVDIATDPVSYVFSPGFVYLIGGVTAVQFKADSRDEYDNLKRTSVDFYATLRSVYRQIRQNQISNGGADPTALSYELTGVGVDDDDSSEASLNP